MTSLDLLFQFLLLRVRLTWFARVALGRVLLVRADSVLAGLCLPRQRLGARATDSSLTNEAPGELS